MKRTLALMLVLIMALAILPGAALATEGGSTQSEPVAEGGAAPTGTGNTNTAITDFNGLKDAVSNGGEYTLDADIAISEQLTIAAGKTVTIDGKGHTLTYGTAEGAATPYTGSLFRVEKDSKLTLKSVTIDGGEETWKFEGNGAQTNVKDFSLYNIQGTPKSVTVNNDKGTVVLSGITVKNLVTTKTAHQTAGEFVNAGLLHTTGGNATLTDITMTNCFGGGGLLVCAQNSDVKINNSKVTNIFAIKNGALICCYSGVNLDIDGLTVKDNSFSDNGAIMAAYANSNITVKNSTFTNNTHYDGPNGNFGGIIYTRSYSQKETTTVSITNTTITNNMNKGTASGSLVANSKGSTSSMTINSGCTISSNGGYLYVYENEKMTVNDGVTIGDNVQVREYATLINNGTINGDLSLDTTSNNSISSGNVKGNIEVKRGTLTITGGYYNVDVNTLPNVKLGKGLTVVENPDGNGYKYKVVRSSWWLKNPIEDLSKNRIVKQNGIVKSADSSGRYCVSSDRKNITVDYTATMDMSKLYGDDVVNNLIKESNAQDAWGLLNTYKTLISEQTRVYLTFNFSDYIDLSNYSLDSLVLASDMFEKIDAKKSGNTITVTCGWKKGQPTEDLNPMITLTGAPLPVKENWGGNSEITITNSGHVSGEVKFNVPTVDLTTTPTTNATTPPAPENIPSLTDSLPIIGESKSDIFKLYYTTGSGGHSHYTPVPTPVPFIVLPPKTGDMTIWQSILGRLGLA